MTPAETQHLHAVGKKGEPPNPELTAKERDFVESCLRANEDGDAALFRHLTQDFIFDHTSAEWYRWAGHFWQPDEKGEIFTALERVIDLYGDQAARQAWLAAKAEKSGNSDAAKTILKLQDEYLKRIRSLQARPRKQNVIFLAAQGHGVTSEAWDRDPWQFACPNGVIYLRTGEIHPGRPEQFIRTGSPVAWQNITTPAPSWDNFLLQIFAEDQELVFYVQRLFGYAMTGLSVEHVLPIFWGQGRNGKGTLVETIEGILGPYAHKGKAETLLDVGRTATRGSADADTLSFRGKRFVYVSETNDGRRFNAGLVKELVGGDTLNARGPYERRPTTFRPTHTLFLLTNNKPHAPADDFAFWERVHLIPFKWSFVDRDPAAPNERRADKNLPERLKEEASGILAWLVRGCLAWQQQGLNPPACVIEATKAYQKDEDIIAQFIDDCCEVAPHLHAQAKPFFEAFRSWCDQNGQKPLNQKRFGIEMKQRFDSESGRNVHYIGIGLKNDPF
jgi:putative DNA primase/helicase